MIVTVCGEHFVSKNPFAIAVGSYENINKIIKCTNDVLFLREDRNVMLSGMGLEWLKQADSAYNVGVFARRGGGHLGGFLWSPYPDCQLHRETATDMNKWNMFCNLYSHECDELGGSHLGLHTPKGCKDTSTPWKVLKPRCWGYSDGQMSFQTPSLCSHVCALQAK